MTGALQRPPEEARGTIRRIEPANVQAVARLMASVKPEWWDTEGAAAQLQDVALLARLVSTVADTDMLPIAFLAALAGGLTGAALRRRRGGAGE